MELEEMLDAVAKSEVDAAAAAITITADREQQLDFSRTRSSPRALGSRYRDAPSLLGFLP